MLPELLEQEAAPEHDPLPTSVVQGLLAQLFSVDSQEHGERLISSTVY